MKRLFTITILLVGVFVSAAFAEERTNEQLINAARKVLYSNGGQRKASASGELAILRRNEQVSIVGYKDGRCAFIANDDSFEPVLGYTDDILPEILPPALEWWINAMDASLSERLAKGKKPNKTKPSAQYKAAVDMLISTQWGQSEPYNNLCPQYVVNNITRRYVTGCVATSMAQVMNYHEYPVKGIGSRSFYLYDDNGGRTRVYANFGNTTYDWNNMLDTYRGSNSYSYEEANAVATLMYHCGVSVEMGYAEDGSGALSKDASEALKKYFGYNASTRYYYRDIYHVDEWMDIIYGELNDGCPIIYGGARQDGGHSFVLDGYNESGLIHINWGWDGAGNGYFDISKADGYNQYQDLIRVRRADDDRINYSFASTWGLLENLTANISIKRLSLTTGAFVNFNEDTFNGYIGVMAMDTTSIQKTLLTTYQEKLTEVYHGYGYSRFPINCSIDGLADGTYRIFLVTKDDNDTDWQPVRSKEGICSNYLLTITNGSGTLKEDDSSWIYNTTTAIKEIEVKMPGKTSDKTFNLSGMEVGENHRGIIIRNGRKILNR